MRNWDYGWNASYYITICTGGRECFFGNIEDGKVKLSEIGIFADKFWLEIPNHFHYVKLDEYIIMPNHIHGIIIIDNKNLINNVAETPNFGIETPNFGIETPNFGIETPNFGIETPNFGIETPNFGIERRPIWASLRQKLVEKTTNGNPGYWG